MEANDWITPQGFFSFPLAIVLPCSSNSLMQRQNGGSKRSETTAKWIMLPSPATALSSLLLEVGTLSSLLLEETYLVMRYITIYPTLWLELTLQMDRCSTSIPPLTSWSTGMTTTPRSRPTPLQCHVTALSSPLGGSWIIVLYAHLLDSCVLRYPQDLLELTL